jgi:glycopeptide antibiotics resistance protein
MEIEIRRRVLVYIAFSAVTVLCGILSRSGLIELPVFVSTYAGDTLWPLMVFWCFCIFRPRWKIWKISLAAILFSFAIEFSQFYHAPWIDALRNTIIGGLILGFGFKFSDLICYLVGILFGACIVGLLLPRQKKAAPFFSDCQ